MANKQRGEVDVKLGGKTWTMRPAFQALCEIEDRTGVGITTLARRFHDGDFGAGPIVAVLWAGIRAAHDDAPDYDEVGRLVVAEGVIGFAAPALAFLLAALLGDGAGTKAAKKAEKKAAAKNP